MLKIILIALAGMLVFFCWCCLRVSSMCSRQEEKREMYVKIEKTLD